MYAFQPNKCQGFKKLITVENVFTAPECSIIKSFFSPGTVAGIRENGESAPAVRSAKLTWLYSDVHTNWIYERLEKVSRQVNSASYNFQLSGFHEALQLTKYETGDHYTWHEDSTEPHFTTRKLSLVVQLSEPVEYQGGSLTIFPNISAGKTLGSVSFFPSYLTHKVSPVKEGERMSLVAWITGEPLR